MPEETIGFVGLSPEEVASLDGIPCHICGMIMARSMQDVFAENPKTYWYCESCGATTGCAEVKDGEK